MSLKKKLLLFISAIAILASISTSILISQMSLGEMRKDAELKAKSDLTAKRVLITSELTNYIETIEKQAKVMANDVSIIEAAQQFTDAFFSFDKSSGNTTSLQSYYEKQFKPTYDEQNTDTLSVNSLYNSLPDITTSLQSQFISLNPHPLGEKDKLNSIGDQSNYDRLHQKYHSTIRTFLQEFGYYDVFIVEPSDGYIVYSVFKELDFATSLRNGS